MKVHEKIREYIYQNNMTINEVGDKTNIEIKRFYRIIAGESKMTADELGVISKALGINPNYFFDELFLETKNKCNVS